MKWALNARKKTLKFILDQTKWLKKYITAYETVISKDIL